MDVVSWLRGWFGETVQAKAPKEQIVRLQELLEHLKLFDHSEVVMTRVMPSRFLDIYHLIAMVGDARLNIKAHASLPRGINGVGDRPGKTLADYLTDHTGRAAEHDKCFDHLGEETAKLLDTLARVKDKNEFEHRHYLMGLEVLLLEVELVIAIYTTPQ